MNEETKTPEGEENENLGYIEEIKKLKESTVPKTELEKLKAENKKLLETLLEGGEVPAPAEKKVRTASEIREELFKYDIDYFIDACDTTSVKKEIIRKCINKKVPFISCMGTGNKLDPSKLEICDIRNTSNDPLARMIRKFVKDEKINSKVTVLCSSEVPVKTGERTPGSSMFVPASAGIMIASYVVRKIIKK